MALALQKTVSITVPNGFTVREADADDNGIYVLAMSSNAARILTYGEAGGAALQRITINYNTLWNGLVKYGNGWVVADRYRLIPFSASGVQGTGGTNNFNFSRIWSVDWDESASRFVGWGKSIAFDKNFAVSFFNAEYAPLSNSYVDFENTANVPKDGQGYMTKLGGKWYLATPNGDEQVLLITDENFSILDDETQNLPSDDLRGLATFKGQLTAVTDGRLYFYGTPTPTPDTTGTQQLYLDNKYFQRFDIARSGNPITVLATDIEMLQETAVDYIDVGTDQSIETQLSAIRFTPKFTQLGVQNGDKIFLHTGDAGVAPTVIPNDAYDIQGITGVGRTQRQVFFCE